MLSRNCLVLIAMAMIGLSSGSTLAQGVFTLTPIPNRVTPCPNPPPNPPHRSEVTLPPIADAPPSGVPLAPTSNPPTPPDGGADRPALTSTVREDPTISAPPNPPSPPANPPSPPANPPVGLR